jgi:hypothetical protein
VSSSAALYGWQQRHAVIRPGGFQDAMRRSLEFIRGICRPEVGWALGQDHWRVRNSYL